MNVNPLPSINKLGRGASEGYSIGTKEFREISEFKEFREFNDSLNSLSSLNSLC
jgi:hypothetical protein